VTRRLRREGQSWAAGVLIAAIGGYQRWISPALGPRCRFYPSCSQYAKTAIEVHGALRGVSLAIRRLVKCQPFHPGGFDPVPPARSDHRAPSAVR
jgi:putative membrane protein insertion efficiency factor